MEERWDNMDIWIKSIYNGYSVQSNIQLHRLPKYNNLIQNRISSYIFYNSKWVIVSASTKKTSLSPIQSPQSSLTNPVALLTYKTKTSHPH